MSQPGPSLEALLHHLTECPVDFLEVCQPSAETSPITAIICDFFRPLFQVDTTPFIQSLTAQDTSQLATQRHHTLMSVIVWLLHYEWFTANPAYLELAFGWLQRDPLEKLSEIVMPEQFVADPDRREELARLCLAALGLHPLGETNAQADDRRTTLDSLERKRILDATAAAERRAREIRQEMAKVKAMESASRYGE